jgi:tetratricopeptide (TPR) repeat protein
LYKFQKYPLFLAINFFLSYTVSAQNGKIDSLIRLVKTDKVDSLKIDHLNLLATELRNIDPDTGLIVAKHALDLSEKTGWKKGQADALSILGVCSIVKADYDQGLQYFTKALELVTSMNDMKGVARLIGNIGIVHYSRGDYPKALDYYFKSLRMEEQLGNKKKVPAVTEISVLSITGRMAFQERSTIILDRSLLWKACLRRQGKKATPQRWQIAMGESPSSWVT